MRDGEFYLFFLLGAATIHWSRDIPQKHHKRVWTELIRATARSFMEIVKKRGIYLFFTFLKGRLFRGHYWRKHGDTFREVAPFTISQFRSGLATCRTCYIGTQIPNNSAHVSMLCSFSLALWENGIKMECCQMQREGIACKTSSHIAKSLAGLNATQNVFKHIRSGVNWTSQSFFFNVSHFNAQHLTFNNKSKDLMTVSASQFLFFWGRGRIHRKR